jgi:hypothetical protein
MLLGVTTIPELFRCLTVSLSSGQYFSHLGRLSSKRLQTDITSETFSCTIMRQKSTTVFGVGPCAAIIFLSPYAKGLYVELKSVRELTSIKFALMYESYSGSKNFKSNILSLQDSRGLRSIRECL